jgi:hypothetical protein
MPSLVPGSAQLVDFRDFITWNGGFHGIGVRRFRQKNKELLLTVIRV